MEVEYDEPEGWKPPCLIRKYEMVDDKESCGLESPNGWYCYRKKRHSGQHEASSEVHEGFAWARWSI